MSRPKDIAIVCLAVSSGVLALLTWRQHSEIRRLTSALDDINVGSAAPLTIHSATNRRFTIASPRSRAGVTTGSEGVARDAREDFVSGLGREPRNPGARSRRTSAIARLMENPEFVEVLALQRQAIIDARFAALFRQLNLTTEELTAFKKLLAEKDNVALDVVAVSESMPDGPLAPSALRASVREAQVQVEQAIHSSLGSERYAIYREYERTIAQRATVAQLEQRLSYTGTPLTPTQSDALVRILVANTPKTAPESAAPMSVVVRAGVPEAVPILPTSASTGGVTEEAVTHAQTVLAPQQLNALREIQFEQQAAVRAAAMIRDALPPRDEAPVWSMMLLQ